MLKTILSVTGKPGLFKLISSGKNMVIVESLTEKKKLPIYARDKVVSLGDIAMYTEEGEVPLQEVLVSIRKKEDGKTASILPSAKPEELRKYLGEVLPSFDKERIYNADIKKLVSWYNLLISNNIDFEAVAEEQETAVEEAPKVEEVKAVEKEKKAKEPKASKEPKKTEATAKKTAAPKKAKTEGAKTAPKAKDKPSKGE